MDQVRSLVTEGLALRAKTQLKVRQPLAMATVYGVPDLSQEMKEIIAEELNVKAVVAVPASPKVKADQTFIEVVENAEGTHVGLGLKITLDTELTPALKREGLVREVIRQVQNARKQAGLQVDDRISLVLETDGSDLMQALGDFSEEIKQEVLASSLSYSGLSGVNETAVKIEGVDLAVRLEKA